MIKRYIKIGYNLIDRTNIEIALQSLSETSIVHIESNRNIKTLVDQDNIEINSG